MRNPRFEPRRDIRWTAAAILLCGLGALALAVAGTSELDLLVNRRTRLLVIAPHPDDEALGAAGLIQRVIAAHGSVRVVLMTSGDAFPEGIQAATHIRRPTPRDYRNYGTLREHETAIAMQRLGLDRTHLLFLGFPDGGLCFIASKYLSARTRPYDSPFTAREEPPASERLTPGIRYRGADVRSELEHLLVAYRPTLLVIPHADDHHPEHCATYMFVREALDAVEARRDHIAPRVLQYLIHFRQWPLDAAADSASPLAPPRDFPEGQGRWRTLTLTPAETALKQHVIEDYSSQLLVMDRFLRAFGRSNELFAEGRPGARPECWCDDKTVATETPREQYRRRPSPRQ
jgi:LmbE family N-acetylglucosaminyl deacetylase